MSHVFADTPPAFLSTGAVARILGRKPDEIRALIDSGYLPQPQLMSMGRRIERVYSQEWVALAEEAENSQRLDGLESWHPPEGVSQFVIRLDQTVWKLPDAVERLDAIDRLWHACMAALGVEQSEVPVLDVRRLSAGSPLDVLVWVAGLPVTGVAIWLMRTAINSPEKLVGIIPRSVAGWHSSKADENDAKSRRIESEQRLKAIRAAAQEIVGSNETSVHMVVSGPTLERAEIEAQELQLEIEANPEHDSGVEPDAE